MHARGRAEFPITEAAQSQVTGTAGVLSRHRNCVRTRLLLPRPVPYRDLTFCKFRALYLTEFQPSKKPNLSYTIIQSAHAMQALTGSDVECPANAERGTSDNQGILQSLH